MRQDLLGRRARPAENGLAGGPGGRQRGIFDISDGELSLLSFMQSPWCPKQDIGIELAPRKINQPRDCLIDL
jgi:hypothetical protein